MAIINFNAESITPSVSYDTVPAGQYSAIITDSELRANRAGTGHYLRFTFRIIDGEYSGYRVWSCLNIDNPNPDTVRMANEDLSAICHAVGNLHPADTVELHNIPLRINVNCRRMENGSTLNFVKGFRRNSGTR